MSDALNALAPVQATGGGAAPFRSRSSDSLEPLPYSTVVV